MKAIQKITLLFALVVLFASCQPGTDVNRILANTDTKKAIMETIADDSNLSSEMIQTIMKSENGKMVMMENHGTMMKLMKDSPGMMESMMTSMMKLCESDTAMMSAMHKSMMKNPHTMDMMHQMMGSKMDIKGMNKMETK